MIIMKRLKMINKNNKNNIFKYLKKTNIYIITMFILPPGLSDNDVKLIMKLYETG